MKRQCNSFQWIGQPITSCDGCGKPAWDHDYREVAVVDSVRVDAPWAYWVVGDWLQHGVINQKRAVFLVELKVRSEQ
jgi:hypothetical protein